jgi:hypothetical protein
MRATVFRHIVRTVPAWEHLKNKRMNPETAAYHQSRTRQGSYYFQVNDGQSVRIKTRGGHVDDDATEPSRLGVFMAGMIKYISREDSELFRSPYGGGSNFVFSASTVDAPEVGGFIYDGGPTFDKVPGEESLYQKRYEDLRNKPDLSMTDLNSQNMHSSTNIAEIIK